jgi:hypothetical protein
MKQALLQAPKFYFTNFFTVTFKRPGTYQIVEKGSQKSGQIRWSEQTEKQKELLQLIKESQNI